MARVDPEALLLVGRVWRAHGTQGEIKVIPETDDPQRLAGLQTVHIGPDPERATPYEVEAVRFQYPRRGPIALIRLEAVAERETAESLRSLRVYADVAALPPLRDDEFFLHDIIGLRVVTDAGAPVGTVHEVMDLPAQSIAVVRREGAADALIPLVPAFIANLDFDAQTLVIRPIEGLLD
ncbi:MAG: 16S rRNA processing protein RimM [Bacteroidetes bacterium]|nr:MAG: 16S rRNA processing protein RimM [Bacteroidota bacterium]